MNDKKFEVRRRRVSNRTTVRTVPKGRCYQSPGQDNASAASVVAALGTQVKLSGSHNVAALNGAGCGINTPPIILSFQDEFRELSRRHGLELDGQYA